MFEITISFSLSKREKDVAKGGVDSFRSEHGNKGAKTLKMQRSDDVPR